MYPLNWANYSGLLNDYISISVYAKQTVKPVAIEEDEAEPAENKDEEKVKDVEKVEDREGQREGEEPQKKVGKLTTTKNMYTFTCNVYFFYWS